MSPRGWDWGVLGGGEPPVRKSRWRTGTGDGVTPKPQGSAVPGEDGEAELAAASEIPVPKKLGGGFGEPPLFTIPMPFAPLLGSPCLSFPVPSVATEGTARPRATIPTPVTAGLQPRGDTTGEGAGAPHPGTRHPRTGLDLFP